MDPLSLLLHLRAFRSTLGHSLPIHYQGGVTLIRMEYCYCRRILGRYTALQRIQMNSSSLSLKVAILEHIK